MLVSWPSSVLGGLGVAWVGGGTLLSAIPLAYLPAHLPSGLLACLPGEGHKCQGEVWQCKMVEGWLPRVVEGGYRRGIRLGGVRGGRGVVCPWWEGLWEGAKSPAHHNTTPTHLLCSAHTT